MDTSERRFESEIEYWLTTQGSDFDRFETRDPQGFDRELCLYPADLIEFVKTTQPDQWAKLERTYRGNAEQKFLKRVAAQLDQRGVIDVLRRGIEDVGARFKLVYFAPGTDLNEVLAEKYWANEMSIVRQLRYSTRNENSVDTVLLVNGIPVVTLELKNQLTGQTYRDAIRQYKMDRSPSEKLFALGNARWYTLRLTPMRCG